MKPKSVAKGVHGVTVSGIRPDSLGMDKVFERHDETFTHTMIHTGQHYDAALSTVFFRELNIHTPDYTLSTGQESQNRSEQRSYLFTALIELLEEQKLEHAVVLFLGDSSSALVSASSSKQGCVPMTGACRKRSTV